MPVRLVGSIASTDGLAHHGLDTAAGERRAGDLPTRGVERTVGPSRRSLLWRPGGQLVTAHIDRYPQLETSRCKARLPAGLSHGTGPLWLRRAHHRPAARHRWLRARQVVDRGGGEVAIR